MLIERIDLYCENFVRSILVRLALSTRIRVSSFSSPPIRFGSLNYIDDEHYETRKWLAQMKARSILPLHI